jgi:hypothetical protein
MVTLTINIAFALAIVICQTAHSLAMSEQSLQLCLMFVCCLFYAAPRPKAFSFCEVSPGRTPKMLGSLDAIPLRQLCVNSRTSETLLLA